MSNGRREGFRLGIYIFDRAEAVDFAAPYGVFSVARRFEPSLEAFFVADSMRPVQAEAGFTVLPKHPFADRPAIDAFLIPGGPGTRVDTFNARLHEFIHSSRTRRSSPRSAPDLGFTRRWACSTACARQHGRSPTR